MRESIIQTTINKFLTWLAKKSVTALYRRTHFMTYSWGLDEYTDLYLISEESYLDRHRFGVHEEKIVDTPQTEETCERCVYVRGSQWCQGCNGTPKRWNGETVVDTSQTDCAWK